MKIQVKLMILVFTLLSIQIRIYSQISTSILKPDTIDYENKRLYIEIPEVSLFMSSEDTWTEGYSVCYPYPNLNNPEKPSFIAVESSVMTPNWLFSTNDFDEEIWNTFNKDHVGSRCFKKDGFFYRIDRFYDGLRIFYEHVPPESFALFNNIIRSVTKHTRKNDEKPLDNKKRRHYYVHDYDYDLE